MSPLQLRIPVDDARPAALAVVAGCLAEALPLEDLLGRVLEGAMDALGAEAGSILCTGLHAVGTALAVLRGRSAEQRQALQRLHDEARLADAVLASGEPLALADLPRDVRFHGGLRASLRAADLRAYAGVPLLTSAGVRGVLAVAGTGSSFSAADLEFLATLARQVALLVDNAALSLASDRWRAAAAALAQLGRGAAGTGGVPRILEGVAEQALAVVGGEACGVFVLDKAAGHLILTRSIGLEGRPGAREPVPLGRGVAGRSVASRAPAAAGDGREPTAGWEVGFPAALAVPLMVWGEPFGALAIYRARPDPFPEVDAGLLALVAVHAGIALENAQLHAETVRKREEAEALQALTRLISSTLDPDEIFRVLIERTCQVLGVTRCGLWEVRQEGEDLELRLQRSVGLDPRDWEGVHLRLGEGTTGGCIARRAPVWTADILQDPAIPLSEAARRRVAAEGYRAVCSAPILLPEGPFGVLAIYRGEPHAFDAREVALLSAFAGQAALAIANARLYEDVRRKSHDLEVSARNLRELSDLSVAMQSSLSLDEQLAMIVMGVHAVLDLDRINILLAEDGGRWLRCVAAHGVADPTAEVRVPTTSEGGALAVAFRERRDVVVGGPGDLRPEYRLGPPYRQMETLRSRSFCVIPLVAKGEAIGVLAADNKPSGRPIPPEVVPLLKIFAAHAAIAIENARLFHQEQARRRQVEAVRAVTGEIQRELDLTTLLGLIQWRAAELVGATSGAVYLWDEEAEVLVPKAWYGHGEWMREARLRLGEDITGAVARQLRGLIVNDYRNWPDASPLMLERTGVTAALAEPLLYRDHLVGVITMNHEEPGRVFTEADRESLALFVAQAAIAIENARLYGEAEQRRREAEVLAEVARDINASLNLQGVLRRVAEGAKELCGSDMAGIALWDHGAEAMVFRHRIGNRSQAYDALRIKLGGGIGGRVLVAGRPFRTPHYAEDPRVNRDDLDAVREEGIVAEMVVPIRTGDRVEGLLYVDNRTARPFTDRDEAILQRLADYAAIAIENARLYSQTREGLEELEAIHRAGQAIAQSLDLDETLKHILVVAMRLTEADKGTIHLLDEERQELVATSVVGLTVDGVLRVPLAEPSLAAACLREGQVLVSESPDTDPRCSPTLQARYRNKALVVVPLRSGNRIIGVLDVGDRQRARRFGAREIAVLERLAQQAVVAIENARLFHQEQARRRQVEAIRAATAELLRELDLPALLDLIQRRAAELVGATSGGIWLWDEAAQFLVPEAWHGHGEWIREERRPLGEGITGMVAQRRQGLIVNDYRNWPQAIPLFLERTAITATMAEPLQYRGRLLGVITVDDHGTGRRFSEQDRETLALFAAQAAVAIENARLYQEERNRSRDLSALIRASRAVTSSLDLTQILGAIVTSAVELTGASLANLLLVEAGGPLEWQACADALQQELAQATASGPITVGRSLSEEVAAGRQSLWVPDITTDPREVRGDFIARHGIRCYLGVPILGGERVLGVLSVLGPADGGVNEGRRELLESLAAQAALAIENARLYAQSREAFDELAAIHEASQAVAQSLDLQETLQRILAAAMRLTDTDNGVMRLLDEERRELVEACAVGVPADPAARLPLDEPFLSAACLREGRVLISESPADDPRCNPALQARYGNKALIAVPLRSGTRIIGVLDIGDLKRSRRFGAREIAILERLAQQAVVAIENARLFGQVLRSKSEWEHTFDSMSDLVAVLDLEGRIVRANRALLRRLGLPPGQALRRSCGDVLGDGGAAWGGCPHRRALRAAAPVALEVEDEKLGGTYSVNVFPVRDADGQVIGTVHIARDITEQKAIQAKLFQADKLASMGTLAAGVAHSINNVLAAIVARADLLQASAAEPETRRSAEVIQQAAMDGAETVRRLQEFAKIKPRPAVALVDVNQAVRDALELTQARWRDEAQARGAPIAVETRLEAAAPIEGNAAEIREVLVNLILNAADAMPDGGSLRITTADRPRRKAAAAGRDGVVDPAGTVEVRVEDTGIGMSEAVRRRIFDPFFTTKGIAGTGLGLSVSYGLVTKYRGEITVRSREGEGTTFTLTFPVAGASPGATAGPGPTADPRLGRVLLIEDEAALREAMVEALIRAGHQVEAVVGGREGLERFRPGAFDVVLTDLGMPEVSGLDVARAVKAADPTVYVIVCTGWGNVPGAEEPLRERGVDALLAKPFRIAEVVKAVRAGLEARAASA